MNKLCFHCKQKRPLKEFHKAKKNKDGLASWCKNCVKAIRQNPQWKMEKQLYDLENRYGLTLEQYEDLFNIDNGCCAICGKHYLQFKNNLHIDHDHKTGLIRGMLCCRCNVGLGFYENNKDQIENYLTTYPLKILQLYRKWLVEEQNDSA